MPVKVKPAKCIGVAFKAHVKSLTVCVTFVITETHYVNGENMNLEKWRLKKGMSYTALADKIGAPHATVVRRWCLGLDHKDYKIPSPKYMEIIKNATMGEVTPNDFYG